MQKPLQPLAIGVVAFAAIASAPSAFAQVSFDNDDDDGLWTTVNNWSANALPGAADEVEINHGALANDLPLFEGVPTVTLNNGTHSIDNFVIGDTGAEFADIRLRITGNAVLNLSSDTRVGRGGDDADNLNTTVSLILDGNATINMTGSTTDLKLSGDDQTNSQNSLFSIRDNASFITQGTINFGRPDNGNNLQSAVLEIVGSNATINVEDIKTETGNVPGTIRWVLDSGGASPLIVNDDFQMEFLSFELALADVPPVGTIVLARADRLSNDNQFVGLPEDADVSAVFGNVVYTWDINYADSADDGTVIDAIWLDNLRTEVIPEPATAVLGLMGVGLLATRRRQ